MRKETVSSNTYSETSEIPDNCIEVYVYHPNDRSKHTFLIHGPSRSSDSWNFLGDFGSKYSKIRPTKDRGHVPVGRNEFNIQQENNVIVNHAVDEIILQKKNIGSSVAEAHENIEHEMYDNNI